MECADILIASGRRSRSPSWRPARQWRKALTAFRTCHRLARRGILSARVLPRSTSYVAIKISHHDSGADPFGNVAEAFSLAADDDSFKCLVKEKREECFRRLGGGAGIAAALASHAERGIGGDEADVRRRRVAFGGNAYPKPKPKPKSFLSHVWDALSDLFLIVLLVCAAVSLGFGIKEHGLKDGWYDGVSIFLAVFLVAAVSAVSNHGRFDKLASDSDNVAVTVVRAARRQEVSIFEVVVGDVVVLKIGDSVPADGVFLEGHGLQVDESSMTGEPHPIEIDAEKSPFLNAGVKIIDGYGRMLVTAVGTDTLWGEMMSSITKETTEPTPLQERLEGLTSSINKIGVAVAVLVFAVLTACHFTGSTKDDQGKPLFDKGHVTFDAVFSALVVIFQQAVTIIVVAMPEGLKLAVTLTLAFSMKRMVKENALVRRRSACETMGSVTAICTDKTGTLTLNQMKVTEFWMGTEQPRPPTAIAGSVVSLLCQGAGINTTGSVYKPDNVSPPEISGSPTEKALLSWAVADVGMDADALKRSCKVLHVQGTRTNSIQEHRVDMHISDDDTPSDENGKNMKGRRSYIFTMANSSLAGVLGLVPHWLFSCSDKIWTDHLLIGYILLLITAVLVTGHSSQFKDGELPDNAGFKLLQLVQALVLLCLLAGLFTPLHVCRSMSYLVVWISASGALLMILISWSIVFHHKTLIKCIKAPYDMVIKCIMVPYQMVVKCPKLLYEKVQQCLPGQSLTFKKMPEEKSNPGVPMETV